LKYTYGWIYPEKRKKQFTLLFACIDDLGRALKAEEEEATSKRKRLASEMDDKTTDGHSKRLREDKMEESHDDNGGDTEPGEIPPHTKGTDDSLLFSFLVSCSLPLFPFLSIRATD